MKMIEALILGLVQGLTEFLPVSSSAHLRIAGIFLEGGKDPGAAFTAIIQLGTELAVLVYFRRDIVRIVAAFVRGLAKKEARADPDFRMACLIIVGSIPIIVLGLAFQTLIENQFRSLWIVAIDLIVFGILLGIADRVGRKRKDIDRLTVRDGVIYGLAQSLALVPGVSRSGGTIGAGLLLGYKREAAARYSFLLALPAVFGSGLYELFKVVKGSDGPPEIFSGVETLAATVVAFVVGLAVIAFFLRYLTRGSFLPFVAYRILIGVFVIGLLLSGVVKP